MIGMVSAKKRKARDTCEVILGFMSPNHIVHHSKLEAYKAETKKRLIELCKRFNYLQQHQFAMYKEIDENTCKCKCNSKSDEGK